MPWAMIYIGSGLIGYGRETCASCARKTVGPPYSGKLNVRWDGKGMVTDHGRASEALQGGNPQQQIGAVYRR